MVSPTRTVGTTGTAGCWGTLALSALAADGEPSASSASKHTAFVLILSPKMRDKIWNLSYVLLACTMKCALYVVCVNNANVVFIVTMQVASFPGLLHELRRRLGGHTQPYLELHTSCIPSLVTSGPFIIFWVGPGDVLIANEGGVASEHVHLMICYCLQNLMEKPNAVFPARDGPA